MFAKSALTQPSSNAELQKKHEISKKYLEKLLQTSIKVKTKYCIHIMGTTLTKIAKTKKKHFSINPYHIRDAAECLKKDFKNPIKKISKLRKKLRGHQGNSIYITPPIYITPSSDFRVFGKFSEDFFASGG